MEFEDAIHWLKRGIDIKRECWNTCWILVKHPNKSKFYIFEKLENGNFREIKHIEMDDLFGDDWVICFEE